ncbi:hypothetical protein OE88DRAFT_1656896 [Heliocybe sulcata]|uniref:Uncharacterized protein n=1 Tax=Heliocybe sulcata TaxID=5364 RepID=A0A5C3N715_9AGAM|nr:hypothetical protein OE88DRAFT_1656896 [Heliocybe sulcata]
MYEISADDAQLYMPHSWYLRATGRTRPTVVHIVPITRHPDIRLFMKRSSLLIQSCIHIVVLADRLGGSVTKYKFYHA